jgi:hypothetical protein
MVDALRNVVHGSGTVQDAAREKAFMFPQGPLPSLIPKEYLLETLVMPGLVEALGAGPLTRTRSLVQFNLSLLVPDST